MMTDKQKEVAAIKLCRLRGFDPFRLVPHGAPPSKDGCVPMVLLHSPAWVVAMQEIEAHEQLESAIRLGREHGQSEQTETC